MYWLSILKRFQIELTVKYIISQNRAIHKKFAKQYNTKEAHVVSGVPQGSVLGPVLFLAFINDLPGCTKNSTTRLFADDCVLYKRIASHHDTKLLQEDLDALQDWEHTWHMQFHPSKCQVLRVTKKRKPITSSYNIHGTILEEVTSAKYLRVHIDSNINFNTHIDVITKKANSTRAFLQRNFSRCSRKIKEATYKTYVRPIIEYASTTWDPHTQRNIRKLEQVQRNSARYVTGNHDQRSSVTAMLNELKWQVPREQTQAVPTRHVVQDALRPGRRWLEKPPVTIYINHQRSRMSILDATLHLTSILLILLPSHMPGLEHPEEGSKRLLNTRCFYHIIEGSLCVARSQRTMFLAAPHCNYMHLESTCSL